MSRLQVGGLALVLDSNYKDNIGKVVELISNQGLAISGWDGKTYNYWEIKYSHRHENFFCPDIFLMPLGDKQTQDQFKKEECEA